MACSSIKPPMTPPRPLAAALRQRNILDVVFAYYRLWRRCAAPIERAEVVMKVLVTGAAGNGGQAVCQRLVSAGVSLRMADVSAPPVSMEGTEFVRCDTRTPIDV